MTITTTQKIIKIGTSNGITLPAKDLRALGVNTGDEIEIIVRKKTDVASDEQIRETAAALLQKYSDDFTNLAQR